MRQEHLRLEEWFAEEQGLARELPADRKIAGELLREMKTQELQRSLQFRMGSPASAKAAAGSMLLLSARRHRKPTEGWW